jgi:hypothetical protein
MANKEQLAILLKGVEVWKQWRAQNPGASIDLSEANLRNAELRGVDLREANLRGADLSDADLREADLTDADLRDAVLTRTNLAAARMTGVYLRGANLEDAIREPDPPQKNRGALPESQGASVEDDVFFTAIHPKEGSVETWHTLLVYAHLLSAMEDVRRDAKRFAEQIPGSKEIMSDSATRIARGTEITIAPTCEGVVFNPERIAIKWMESYHRADFRFRAEKALANDAARGQIGIHVGPLLVGSVKFALLLSETEAETAGDEMQSGRMYSQEEIFVSYSHKDSAIALACKKAYEALGFNVLIDVDTLRAGQIWNEELMRMIDKATIFQLFWSENSSKSQYCRQEWEYALQRNREGFIRPVYWENPAPKPPEELSKYHFDYVPFP